MSLEMKENSTIKSKGDQRFMLIPLETLEIAQPLLRPQLDEWAGTCAASESLLYFTNPP